MRATVETTKGPVHVAACLPTMPAGVVAVDLGVPPLSVRVFLTPEQAFSIAANLNQAGVEAKESRSAAYQAKYAAKGGAA